MANYPLSIASFTTKANSQIIDASHINSLQDEVVALETDLLKAWTAFTPTWTNLTVGNATNSGKYLQIGKIVWFRIDLALGNTSSVSASAVSVNFPVTAAIGSSFAVAHGEAIDISTGDAFDVHGRLASAAAFAIFTDNGTKLVTMTSTVPFTWTTSDELHLVGFYESA
jgi:hypothetical protein